MFYSDFSAVAAAIAIVIVQSPHFSPDISFSIQHLMNDCIDFFSTDVIVPTTTNEM